jgi:hypothetical protein
MSEHVLSEERRIEEGISTATLAGLHEPTMRNNEEDVLEREEDVVESDHSRHDADTGPLPADLMGRGANAADRTAVKTPAPAAQKSTAAEGQCAPLFPAGEATELHSRWDAIQVGFVDEPRQAVEQADALVAGAMKRMAEIFAAERARLEGQWDRGDSVSTEDLRLALRRYRSFFGRVLSV